MHKVVRMSSASEQTAELLSIKSLKYNGCIFSIKIKKQVRIAEDVMENIAIVKATSKKI